MQLRDKMKALEHLDHTGHIVALVLVGAAAGAELITTLLPDVRHRPEVEGVEPFLAGLLHWVHLSALFVALVYVLARLFLKRNVGKELARLLPRETASVNEEADGPPVSSEDARSYGYDKITLSPDHFTFVSSVHDQSATTLFEMNEEAFARSSFEINQTTLRRRNTDWIAKNPLVFMLVRLPIGMPRRDGESLVSRPYFGYTSIVPLNDIGTDVYMRGLIKDKDLPASLVAAPGEPSQALLIFAAALKEEYRHDQSLATPYISLLLRAVRHHIDVVAHAHATHPRGTNVWTQSEHASIVDHLRRRGFRGTEPPTMSAEGFELLYRPVTGARSAASD